MMRQILATVLVVCTWTFCHGAGEFELYTSAGARCSAEHGQQAAKVAFEKYQVWKRARDQGRKAPPGAFRDAGQAFDYLVRSGCKDGLVLYRYGNLLRHKRQYDKAIKVIEQSLPDLSENYSSHLSSAYYVLGYCSTKTEHYDDAIKYYRLSIQHDPEEVDSRINLATRLYWKGRHDQAAEAANYVLQSKTLKVSRWGLGQCHNLLGWIALDSGQPNQAIECFAEAYELRKYPWDLEGLAWAYEKTDPKRARDYWDRILKVRKGSAEPKFLPQTEERIEQMMSDAGAPSKK